jgi:hypothetical protein
MQRVTDNGVSRIAAHAAAILEWQTARDLSVNASSVEGGALPKYAG